MVFCEIDMFYFEIGLTLAGFLPLRMVLTTRSNMFKSDYVSLLLTLIKGSTILKVKVLITLKFLALPSSSSFKGIKTISYHLSQL